MEEVEAAMGGEGAEAGTEELSRERCRAFASRIIYLSPDQQS